MSWLSRSIANSLTVTDASGKESTEVGEVSDKQSNSYTSTPSSPPEDQPGRGVKDDLSEITNSLARQLHGVASFLAPPPNTNSKIDDEPETDLGKIDGIRSDFAEIRVKVKARISKLLHSRPDNRSDEDGGDGKSVIGVTEEGLAFVKDLVTHPRTWIVEARAMLTQESKQRRKVKQPEGSPILSNVQDGSPPSMEPSMKDVPIAASPADSAVAGASAELETQKQHTPSDDNSARNEAHADADHKHIKAVSSISSDILVHGEDDDDDGDDWLNDETLDVDGDTIRHIPINNDEDVSFSDLEEDDATGPAKGNK